MGWADAVSRADFSEAQFSNLTMDVCSALEVGSSTGKTGALSGV